MAKSAQRARIEAVAGIIFDRMIVDPDFSFHEAYTQNVTIGWTYAMPSSAGPDNWLQVEGVSLNDWELEQAYTLAAAHARDPHVEMIWTDPRKTGRPPTYAEPLQPVALELPGALIEAVEAARGEATRREWIETAIRQRLERDAGQ